jgi:hypothetical protein
MRHDSPSITDVLTDLGGYAFVLGFLVMGFFPFALPVLLFGVLLLPLLLPFLLGGLLYAMVALPRRYFAARKLRSSPRAKTQRGRQLSASAS